MRYLGQDHAVLVRIPQNQGTQVSSVGPNLTRNSGLSQRGSQCIQQWRSHRRSHEVANGADRGSTYFVDITWLSLQKGCSLYVRPFLSNIFDLMFASIYDS